MGECKEIAEFAVPGQYRYEDMLLSSHCTDESLHLTKDFPLTENDTIIASYPKAGTTLLSETVWLLKNNADLETSRKVPATSRVIFLNWNRNSQKTPKERFDALPPSRCVQTHAPLRYLPKSFQDGTAKCICIFRNPKDALVSWFHYHRSSSMLGMFPGTWDDFFEYFQRNDYLVMHGNPVDHMRAYWEKRHLPNLHIVFYEDLVLNKEKTVCELDEFLQTNQSDENIAKIVEATSFEHMKKSPTTNYSIEKPKDFVLGRTWFVDDKISPYMRKGKVGDWKNHFNKEQNRIMDEMIENRLSGTGLDFYYG